jgi:hypothetical protein
MRFFVLTLIALAIFAVISGVARKSGKLNEAASNAVSGMATCVRYFIHGVLAFCGFAFALFIAQILFGWK